MKISPDLKFAAITRSGSTQTSNHHGETALPVVK